MKPPAPAPALREAVPADVPALAALLHDAVRRGTAAHYSEAERAAWSPAPPGTAAFAARLSGQLVLVAEADGAPAGFMALTPDGLLDLAFVAPDRAGQGVGSALLAAVEARAAALGLRRLVTDASLAARPFLEARGWRVIAEQHPVRHGVALRNFRMERLLPGDA